MPSQADFLRAFRAQKTHMKRKTGPTSAKEA